MDGYAVIQALTASWSAKLNLFNRMLRSVGDKLGPYEIIAPIDAGGMGEVWKARDTRLNRFVAIKTSRPAEDV